MSGVFRFAAKSCNSAKLGEGVAMEPRDILRMRVYLGSDAEDLYERLAVSTRPGRDLVSLARLGLQAEIETRERMAALRDGAGNIQNLAIASAKIPKPSSGLSRQSLNSEKMQAPAQVNNEELDDALDGLLHMPD